MRGMGTKLLSAALATCLAFAGWPVAALEGLLPTREALAIGGQMPQGYEHEEDRQVLPAPWDGGHIDAFYDYQAQDGMDGTYSVTNVTSSNPNVVELHQSDDGGWDYWGNALGASTLTVSYDDGSPKAYSFDVNVTTDVHTADAWATTHSHYVVPGMEASLYADVWHRWVTDYGTDHASYHEEQIVDGITWSADAGNRFSDDASIQASGNRANVTLRNVADEEERAHLEDSKECFTASYVVDGVVVASDSTWLQPCEYTTTILPGVLDNGNWSGVAEPLHVGETRTYDLMTEEDWLQATEVGEDPQTGSKVYTYNAVSHGPSAKEGLVYELENVDERVFACSVNNETQQFTVTRVGSDGASFGIKASWTDENGVEHEAHRQYFAQGMNYRTQFDDPHTNQLFDDDDLTLSMDMGRFEGINTENVRFEYHVGDYVDDQGTFEDYVMDGLYTVSGDTHALTLHGPAFAQTDRNYVKVWAVAYVEANGRRFDLCRTDYDLDFHLREQEVDYRTWEWARDYNMLSGWSQWLSTNHNGWANTGAHPDEDFDYRIVDLQVAESHPWDDGQAVVELEGPEANDGQGWDIHALSYGDAKLVATYELLDGNGATATEEFWVHVRTDFYEASVSASAYESDGWHRALPGNTVTLRATGQRHGKSDHFDTYYATWEVEGNQEWVESLEVDKNDPTVAYLRFKDIPAGTEAQFRTLLEEYRVRATLYVDGTDPEDEVTRSEDLNVLLQSGYLELLPDSIQNLDVGQSVTVTPTATFYNLGARSGVRATILDPEWGRFVDSHGTWEGWDPSVLNIVDNKNGSYTITRVGPGETNVCFRCRWQAGDEGDYKDRWYHFDEKHYEVRFDGDEGTFDGGAAYEVHRDWSTNVRVRTDDLGNNSVRFEVGQGHWANESTWVWDELYNEASGVYTLGSDGVSLVVNGTKLDEMDRAARSREGDAYGEVNGVQVRAVVLATGTDGKTYEAGHNVAWVNLKDTCRHNTHAWSKLVWNPATCEKGGLELWQCYRCGAHRLVNSPALGHDLTKVSAKASTLTATGNIAYYKCDRCGKLFADAAGTKEITLASTVTPKLVNIKTATVSGLATKAYTGKALTQSPKVVLGGKTLKAGTDYTLTYKSNTNPGTATVTIAGKGAYGGSVSKTFTINPKGTLVSKLAAASKAFTATWTKQATQTTGYQLEYATKKNFSSGNKTVTIAKAATTSKKVTKLKAKTTYYVRVRTYKKVGGKTYYSAWSAAKSVKTK